MDPRSLARERTFRWTLGDDTTDGYEAVETRGAELVWYRWSHVHGEGRSDEATQTATSLRAEGPLRRAPPWVLAELHAWAAQATEAGAS